MLKLNELQNKKFKTNHKESQDIKSKNLKKMF